MAGVKIAAAANGGSAEIAGPPSSSANTVLKLPADTGSAGQYLKVATANHSSTNAELEWGTISVPTDTNDYVKLQKATGEDLNSNINFDNLDVATYKFFDLIGTFQPQTDAEHFRMRFRTGGASGSDVTSSDYGYGFTLSYPTNDTGATSASGQNQLLLSGTVGNHASEGISINMRIAFADSSDPATSKYLMNFVTWLGNYKEQGNGFRGVYGSGHLYTASTIPTGFSVSFTSGGIEDYSYCLYGLKR